MPNITFIEGKKNGHADGLSRAPLQAKETDEFDHEILELMANPIQCDPTEETERPSNPTAIEHFPLEENTQQKQELIAAVIPLSTPNIQKLQREDPDFKDIIAYHENKTIPTDSKHAEHVFKEVEKSTIQNGTLYYYPTQSKPLNLQFLFRIALPAVLRAEIMESFHDDIFGGHLGIAKTVQKIATRFYWPKLTQEVTIYCQQCHLCNTRKGVKLQKHAQLNSMPSTKIPFEKVAVDLVGPIHQSIDGHKWIIVFTDYATKWPEAFPLFDATARTIAEIFMEQIVCRHGAPTELLSDRGQNFLANIIKEICEICNTRKHYTCGYSPQTNGLCENFNKTLINMISMYCNTQQDDWPKFIPFCLFAYRTSIHRSTGYSPAELVYGRSLRLPLDTCFQQPRSFNFILDDDYVRLAQNWLTEAREYAKQNNELAQTKQKSQYDKHVKQTQYEVGQQVYIYTPVSKKGYTHKLFHEFHGPYKILQIHLPRLYLQSVDHPRQKKFWAHTTRVKQSHLERIDMPQQAAQPEAPPEDPQAATPNPTPKAEAKVTTPDIPTMPTATKPAEPATNITKTPNKATPNKSANAGTPATPQPTQQATHKYNLRQHPQPKRDFVFHMQTVSISGSGSAVWLLTACVYCLHRALTDLTETRPDPRCRCAPTTDTAPAQPKEAPTAGAGRCTRRLEGTGCGAAWVYFRPGFMAQGAQVIGADDYVPEEEEARAYFALSSDTEFRCEDHLAHGAAHPTEAGELVHPPRRTSQEEPGPMDFQEPLRSSTPIPVELDSSWGTDYSDFNNTSFSLEVDYNWEAR
jgi:hypothetical protein